MGQSPCPTPGRGCEVSMNSYDRRGVAEKLRVMMGSEDCVANLEATGLRALMVFMPEYQMAIFRIARGIGHLVESSSTQMLKVEF